MKQHTAITITVSLMVLLILAIFGFRVFAILAFGDASYPEYLLAVVPKDKEKVDFLLDGQKVQSGHAVCIHHRSGGMILEAVQGDKKQSIEVLDPKNGIIEMLQLKDDGFRILKPQGDSLGLQMVYESRLDTWENFGYNLNYDERSRKLIKTYPDGTPLYEMEGEWQLREKASDGRWEYLSDCLYVKK